MAKEDPNLHLALVKIAADLEEIVVKYFPQDVWLDLLQLRYHLLTCLLFKFVVKDHYFKLSIKYIIQELPSNPAHFQNFEHFVTNSINFLGKFTNLIFELKATDC